MGQINVTIILLRGRITDKEVQEEKTETPLQTRTPKALAATEAEEERGSCLPQDCWRAGGQPLHTLTSELQTVI